MKKYHYVYQITEISSKRKYIGVRSSTVEPYLDIGVKYFSSSSNIEFIKRQRENKKDYSYDVLSIHDDRQSANKEEQRLHEICEVHINDDFINVVKSTSKGFCCVDMVSVRDKDGKFSKVSIYDKRYISGEVVPYNKGRVTIKDGSGKTYTVSAEEFKSGDYVGIASGYASMYDAN